MKRRKILTRFKATEIQKENYDGDEKILQAFDFKNIWNIIFFNMLK